MALLLYFLVFFLAAFVGRSLLAYWRTGINPLVLPGGDGVAAYVGRAFKAVLLGLGAYVALLAFAPHWLHGWPAFPRVGWALLGLALLIALVAQAQMGEAWRIGIDTGRATPLVQHGLFARSRNPIFLSLRLALLGLLLVAPHGLSLALLLLGEVLMQVQVRLEEEHLRRLHGAAYEAYCARVRRWH